MKIKVNFKSSLLLALFTALTTFAFAQRTVTGTVKDTDSGETLVGASVVVTGTTKGTLTDLDGKYELQVPADAASLTFSYTGYANLTIPLGSSKVVDAALKGGSVLEALVVQGYGSVKKKDATGAVNTITEKDFNRGVINSPEQLMQGRVAGVQVSQASGEPGGGINVRIRGTSSVRSNNNPLFVIDGVPLSGDETSATGGNTSLGNSSSKNPLSFMNPNDIASIDILKDASATAIYGSRGANGVVLITTKSGKSGKGTLEYGYDLGVSQITKRYDLLSASEYLKANPNNNQGATTDWQDEIFRTGLTHNHNLSFSAGDAQGSYRFSLGYMNQDGIVKESNVKRYNARFNADRKFLDNKLKIGIQATVSNNIDNNVPITDNAGFAGDLLGMVLKSNPTSPVYKKGTDTLFQPKSADEANPVALLTYSRDITNTIRTLGNINAEYQIIDGLSFKTVVGFDRSLSKRKVGYSSDLNIAGIVGKGRLIVADINSNNSLWENYFNYTKQFGSVNFNGVLGYSYQRFDYATDGTIYAGFRESSLDLMMNNTSSVDAKGGAIVPINSSNPIDELQSYFGRAIFNINEKYVVTATLRADGSTKFGGNNKYGYFPAFAAKWRLIQENFIPKNIFSDLGLRVGYGITGNQEIPHNLYDTRGRYGNWTINDGLEKNDGSFGNVAFANPDLKWEQTSAINFGLDFGFFNNRLSGSLDIYDKSTTGLLIQKVAAQPSPRPFVWDNLNAIVKNQGVELQLNAVAATGKDFTWNVSGNIAYNKNSIKDFVGLIQTGAVNGQGLSGAFAQVISNDQPLFSFYLRQFVGFDEKGNNQLYADGKDFQEIVGKSALPTVTAGLTNSFTYKGFDLGIVFNGVFGNYIYNNTANAYFTKGALNAGRNVTQNVVTNGEGVATSPDVSTRFLEDGSFIRLQNLSLGYNVKLNSSKISSLRVFLNGQNLLLSTSYSGQDPEVSTNKAIDGVPSFGIDYSAYPRARTWTVGANISF